MGQCTSGCYPGCSRAKPACSGTRPHGCQVVEDWDDMLRLDCPHAVLPETDQPKTVPAEYYPAFLNGALHQMWPYLSELILDLLFNVVEPIVQKAVGTHVEFRFDRTSNLGSHPLQFGDTEISRAVKRTEEGVMANIVVKADVDWLANPSLSVHLSSCGIGVKSVSIKGQLVFEFVGMLARPPMFQGLCIYFLNPPAVDVFFQGGAKARLLNVHVVRSKIAAAVSGALKRSMVLPHRVGSTWSSEFDYFQVMSPPPRGILKVLVWRAEGLHAGDLNGRSDPYVLVHCGADSFRSQTKWKTLSPDFGGFQALLPIWAVRHQQVRVEIWDEDLGSADDLLGSVELPVSDLVSWGGEGRSLDLTRSGEECGSGTVSLSAEWRPFLSDPAGAEVDSFGMVFVGVYGADHVPVSHDGAKVWVEVQCTNQLSQGHASAGAKGEPPREPHSTSVHEVSHTGTASRGPGSDDDELARSRSEVRAKAVMGLMKKVALCQKYAMPADDMAQLLDLDLAQVRELAEAKRGGSGRGEEKVHGMSFEKVTWEHAFEFLVHGLETALVSFELKKQEPGKPAVKLGSCTYPVKELMKCAMNTFKDELHLEPQPNIKLKLCLRLSCLGPPSTSQRSWRSSSKIRAR